jgi:hypothetical protein
LIAMLVVVFASGVAGYPQNALGLETTSSVHPDPPLQSEVHTMTPAELEVYWREYEKKYPHPELQGQEPAPEPVSTWLICPLVLIMVTGISALALWSLELGARSRGIETRTRGFSAGRPDAEMGAQTLWDRIESDPWRRRRKAVLITGVLGITIAATFTFFALATRGVPYLWVMFAALLGVPVLVVWFRSDDKSLSGMGYALIWGPDSSKWPQGDPEMLPLYVVPGTMPLVESKLAEMALAAGGRAPQLYIVEDASVNAFVLSGQEVCVTRGLLDLLDYDECAAVFAWLIARLLEPGLLDDDSSSLAQGDAEMTDALALKLLRDPATMMSAWRKIHAADNYTPGSSRLTAGRFLVPPGETAEWREHRLKLLGRLAGAMAASPE